MFLFDKSQEQQQVEFITLHSIEEIERLTIRLCPNLIASYPETHRSFQRYMANLHQSQQASLSSGSESSLLSKLMLASEKQCQLPASVQQALAMAPSLVSALPHAMLNTLLSQAQHLRLQKQGKMSAPVSDGNTAVAPEHNLATLKPVSNTVTQPASGAKAQSALDLGAQAVQGPDVQSASSTTILQPVSDAETLSTLSTENHSALGSETQSALGNSAQSTSKTTLSQPASSVAAHKLSTSNLAQTSASQLAQDKRLVSLEQSMTANLAPTTATRSTLEPQLSSLTTPQQQFISQDMLEAKEHATVSANPPCTATLGSDHLKLQTTSDTQLRGCIVPYSQLKAKQKWHVYYQCRKPSLPHSAPHIISTSALATFDKFIKVKRGLATGANEFFLFNRSKLDATGIPEEYFVKVIPRANFIRQPIFTSQDFAQLEKQDAMVYLLNAPAQVDEPNLKKYLSYGESMDIHRRYLTRHRCPWYALERRQVAPILVSVFNRGNLHVVRNEAQIFNLTTFHSIFVLQKDKTELIFAYLLTNLAKEIILQNRREYGGGLEKLEPLDINHAACINFNHLSTQDEQEILYLYQQYRQQVLSQAQGQSLGNTQGLNPSTQGLNPSTQNLSLNNTQGLTTDNTQGLSQNLSKDFSPNLAYAQNTMMQSSFATTDSCLPLVTQLESGAYATSDPSYEDCQYANYMSTEHYQPELLDGYTPHNAPQHSKEPSKEQSQKPSKAPSKEQSKEQSKNFMPATNLMGHVSNTSAHAQSISQPSSHYQVALPSDTPHPNQERTANYLLEQISEIFQRRL